MTYHVISFNPDLTISKVEADSGYKIIGSFNGNNFHIAENESIVEATNDAQAFLLDLPSIGIFLVKTGEKPTPLYDEPEKLRSIFNITTIDDTKYIYLLNDKKAVVVTDVNLDHLAEADYKFKGLATYYDPANMENCPICGAVKPVGADCNCLETASKIWKSDNKGMHSYNYTPTFRVRGTGKKTFGIELEMKGHEKGHPNMSPSFTDYPFLYLMHDGSLNGKYGVEMASHPFTYKWYLENKDSDPFRINYLKQIGMTTDKDCGLHIHISKDHFPDDKVYKAFRNLMTMNLPFIQKICGRKSGQYYREVNPTMSDDAMNSNDEKYMMIANRGKTIEFRLFAGNIDKVNFAIQFIASTIAYANSVKSQVGWTKYKAWLNPRISEYPELEEFFIKRLVPKGTMPICNDLSWTADWE